MSVDHLRDLPAELVPGADLDDIQDLLVLIGDHRPGDARAAARMASLVAQARSIYIPEHAIKVLALGGGFDAEAQAIHWIREAFRLHALGHLVICGDGAGAREAVSLCRQIERWFPYYDFTSMNLTDIREEENVVARTRIDLLVTIAAPPGDPDLSVPPCVRRALNFHRAPAMPVHASSPAATRVENIALEHLGRQGSDPGRLDGAVSARVMSAIRQELTREDPRYAAQA